MSNSAENGSYFNGPASNDEFLRSALIEIRDDIENSMDDDCFDAEHQLVRDLCNEADRYDLLGLRNNNISLASVTTLNNQKYLFIPVQETLFGLLVRDVKAEKFTLLRGTAYCSSIESINDNYSWKLLTKNFESNNYPSSYVEAASLTVPVIAAKSVLGQYGYLATSETMSQSEPITEEKKMAFADKKQLFFATVEYEGEEFPVYISNQINIIPSPVQDIKFVSE